MKFKKSLGQNLLTDKNILKKIILLTPLKDKKVLEIGSGTGNLSVEILKVKPRKFFLKILNCYLKMRRIYLLLMMIY